MPRSTDVEKMIDVGWSNIRVWIKPVGYNNAAANQRNQHGNPDLILTKTLGSGSGSVALPDGWLWPFVVVECVWGKKQNISLFFKTGTTNCPETERKDTECNGECNADENHFHSSV